MLYSIRNLNIYFPKTGTQVVKHLSFDLKISEIFCLLGETGSGKTMTTKAIMGLLPPEAMFDGEILFKHENLLTKNKAYMRKHRYKHISSVSQNAAAALNPLITIKKHFYLNSPFRLNAEKIKEILKKVSLESSDRFLKKYPFELSGGMKQRLLLALAMIKSPDLIILDEPTRGLDEKTKEEITEEIKKIHKINKSSILIITHDLSFAKNISNQMAVMNHGEIIEHGNTKALFKNPVHPYFKSLINALPENNFLLPKEDLAVYGELQKVATNHYARCKLC